MSILLMGLKDHNLLCYTLLNKIIRIYSLICLVKVYNWIDQTIHLFLQTKHVFCIACKRILLDLVGLDITHWKALA